MSIRNLVLAGAAALVVLAGGARGGAEVAGIAVEATAGVPFTGPVARIFPNPGDQTTDFAADIDWGDGVSSAAVITDAGGAFDVVGTHTYAAAGTPTVDTHLTSTHGDDLHVILPANVTAPVLRTRRAPMLRAVEGVPARHVVALFDTDGAEGPFTAEVEADDPGVEVLGAHAVAFPGVGDGTSNTFVVAVANLTFPTSGTSRLRVQVHDAKDRGASTTAIAEVETAIPAFAAQMTLDPDGITARVTGTVTDTTAEDHVVTIDWGDGVVEKVPTSPSKSAPLLASHAYPRRTAARLFGAHPPFRVAATAADTLGPPGVPVFLPPLPAAGAPAKAPRRRAAPAADFVTRMYLAVLGRGPRRAEKAALEGKLDDATARKAAATALLGTPAALDRWVIEAYAGLLGRRPRNSERKDAASLFAGGADAEDVLAAILASDAFRSAAEARWPDLDAEHAFVTGVALGALGRRPAPDHFAAYRSTLQGGGTDLDFAAAVVASDEARRRFVRGAALRHLGRPAGAGEVAAAVALLGAGTPRRVIVGNLIGTDEFFAATAPVTPPALAGTADRRFVTQLWWDVLGRTPAAAELSAWSKLFADGRTPTEVAAALLHGDEARSRFVVNHFRALLRRDPTAEERTAAVTTLGVSGTAAVATQILSSDEYFALHGGTDDGWVQALLRDVAGTSEIPVGPGVTDPDGALQRALLGAGIGRGAVAAHLFGLYETGTDVHASAAAPAAAGFPEAELLLASLRSAVPYDLGDTATHEIVQARLFGTAGNADRLGAPPPGIRRKKDAVAFLGGVATALLGRAPTQQEQAQWMGVLRGRDGQRRVVSMLDATDEARRRRVVGWLGTALHAPVDEDDPQVDAALDLLRDGASDESVIAGFFAFDPAFATAHRTATGEDGDSTSDDFVAALFLDLLGRAPADDERDALLGTYDDGAGGVLSAGARQAVVRAVLASHEFRTAFVRGFVPPAKSRFILLDGSVRAVARSVASLAMLRVHLLAFRTSLPTLGDD